MRALTTSGRMTAIAISSVLLLLATGIGVRLRHVGQHRQLATAPSVPPARERDSAPPAPLSAVRELPSAFPRNTHLPPIREGDVSGSVDPDLFSPGRDLVYVDDPRVWWESDHDKDDDECDHSVHRAMEIPLRRLIALVCARNGVLEVHDAYRPAKIHSSRSLHKEGRALDITCDELGLEELAKLCWGAGFDWVYYEASAKGGAHVHVSVRRDQDAVERDSTAQQANGR